jgi:hypothetical protein
MDPRAILDIQRYKTIIQFLSLIQLLQCYKKTHITASEGMHTLLHNFKYFLACLNILTHSRSLYRVMYYL